MERHFISKTSFIKFKQCQKYFYYYKKKYKERDKPSLQTLMKFERGHNVGRKAQKLFPHGTDLTNDFVFNYSSTVKKTKSFIKLGLDIIYEAAFQTDKALAITDIMVRDGDYWNIYEVKSAKKVNYTHILDSAYQYWVLVNSGIKIKDFFIVYINSDYVREEKLEIEKLFLKKSVLKDILKLQNYVQKEINKAKQILELSSPPDIKIGEHCSIPYACDFKGICWKNIPEYSLFDVAGLDKKIKFELYNNGKDDLKSLENNLPKGEYLKPEQKIEINCYLQKKEHINREKTLEFLNSLQYPIQYMDFEAVSSAVPLWKDNMPYDFVPFQYSLHIERKESDLEHFEFVAPVGEDPRKPFIDSLLSNLEDKGTILVYGQIFEKNVLIKLSKRFPEYKKRIDKLLDNIKDLMLFFKDRNYYNPRMKGSHSLKTIFNLIQSEYSYKNLNIQKGIMAATVYENLQNSNDRKFIEENIHNLLEYCKLDTMAMVKIVEFLRGKI